MVKSRKTICELILEYFREHQNEELQHGPVVDWVEQQYLKLNNKKPRDVWRSIRRLHQKGILIKVKKGIYKYDPSFISEKGLFEFSELIKEEIFRRDNYKCVVCGRGIDDGLELHADHKIPLYKGGTNSLENGQTLCSEHNFLKKNYSQTEFGKKFLIKLYQEATEKGDQRMIEFCKEIFNVYDKYQINGHITRPDSE